MGIETLIALGGLFFGYLIVLERRLSRIEGQLSVILKELNGFRERKNAS